MATNQIYSSWDTEPQLSHPKPQARNLGKVVISGFVLVDQGLDNKQQILTLLGVGKQGPHCPPVHPRRKQQLVCVCACACLALVQTALHATKRVLHAQSPTPVHTSRKRGAGVCACVRVYERERERTSVRALLLSLYKGP